MHFHRPPLRIAPPLLLIAVLASLQFASAQDLVVGSNSANQSTNLSTGTNNYSNTYVGFTSNSSNNSVTVANTNTLLTNFAAIYVGYDGASNSLIISNGAGVYDLSLIHI